MVCDTNGMKSEVIKHFHHIFSDSGQSSIVDQMNTVRHMPIFFSPQEGSFGSQEVTKEEVEIVLKGFAKSKRPGLDGWSVKLFLDFFDIMEEDIRKVVEESWQNGKVYDGLSTTYIALIPKTHKHVSFGYFRPISLCNLIYKVIAKIIGQEG